jgi:hypothetical protein
MCDALEDIESGEQIAPLHDRVRELTSRYDVP